MPGVPAVLAQSVAECFGLQNSNQELKKIFRHTFSYAFVSSNRTSKLFEDEVPKAMDELKFIVENKRSETGRLGHKEIKVLPTKGRYVIFSDHHLLYRGHRQNFFGENNIELYNKLLKDYLNADYTLIENGDMEDLIVLDPAHEENMLDEFDARKDMLQKCIKNNRDDIADTGALNQLINRRLPFRLRQYKKILADATVDSGNSNLYETIAKFIRKNQYVKIAGNHDYDIQRPEFLTVLNDHLRHVNGPSQLVPTLDRVYDYLLLTTGEKVDFTILHGHQFDKASNPRSAPVAGEVYSEGASWGYQGADRNWKSTDTSHNRLQGWADGHDEFRNNLVDDPEKHPFFGGNGAMFEALFNHTIAWEYFEHKPGDDAFKHEVATGKQFFKFRHLDEMHVADLLSDAFPSEATRPVLLFGHSHEVRMNPGRLVKKASVPLSGSVEYNLTKYEWSTFPHYCNSGSAGRFENLIWGIEINNGEAQVISWRLDENGEHKRHVHLSRDARTFDGRALIAEANSSELPLPTRRRPTSLHAFPDRPQT